MPKNTQNTPAPVKPAPEDVEFNLWRCLSCPESPPLDLPALRAHLQCEHKISAKDPLQGRRSLRLHLDSSRSYLSTYDWEVQGVKLEQTVRMLRETVRQRMQRKAQS